jgi:hypothetical protein
VLFIDVDGVLNPFEAGPASEDRGFVRHHLRPASWIEQHPHLLPEDVPDVPVWLHPDHGEELLDLPYELVWATTWEDDANTYISPRIGLPQLPVVPWSNRHGYGPDGTYFKTADIVRYAAGRPFVWLDDQLEAADRAYVQRHHSGPVRLYDIDPEVGLGLDDFEALAQWADTLPGSWASQGAVR